MNEIVFDVFTYVLTLLCLVFSLLATIMLGTKSNLLEELSIESLRKGTKAGNKRKGSKGSIIFDCFARAFDVCISALSMIILIPILLIAILGLKALKEKNVMRKVEIIGMNGKCLKLHKINTITNEETESRALKRYKKYLHRMSLDELPILISVLKGDVSLLGLARIPYSEKMVLDEVYPELLAQYSKYRPGIVSIFTFEKRFNEGKRSQNELMHDIEFTNDFFLRYRSFGLAAQMISATMISVIQV